MRRRSLLALIVLMTVAIRLLMGGGGAFTVPVFTASTLTSAGTGGGWTTIGGPRAITLAGYTYVGYSDHSGNIVVDVITGGAVTATRTLHAVLEVDLHAAPALFVRDSDHKLVTAYSKHDGPTVYARISTNSLDSDPTLSGGFAAEQDLDTTLGGTAYTYPQLAQLLSEASDPVYLFYRDHEDGLTTGILTFTKSTDGGATWAAQTQLVKKAGKPIYWALQSDGADRIDFALSDGHPILDTAVSLYHFYYQAGSYYKSDGTLISASLPLAVTDLTKVYDGTTDGSCGVSAFAIDDTGHPAIVYGVINDPDFSYRYARWSGSAWSSHEFTSGTDSGNFLISAATGNGSTLFVTKQVSGVYELFRYATGDGGLTFSETQITSGSANTGNFYPTMVADGTTDLQVVVLFGTYTTYLNNSLGIKGVGY